MVTGLRLVKIVKPGQELECLLTRSDILKNLSAGELTTLSRSLNVLWEKAGSLNQREKKNILKKTLNEKRKWVINTIRLPKKQIKKIRGLIHKARFNPELRPQIDGWIANLKPIYGNQLPRQIAVPYQKYLNSLKG